MRRAVDAFLEVAPGLPADAGPRLARALLEAQRGLCDPRAAYDDGRFTVWTATRAPRRRGAAAARLGAPPGPC